MFVSFINEDVKEPSEAPSPAVLLADGKVWPDPDAFVPASVLDWMDGPPELGVAIGLGMVKEASWLFLVALSN